MILISFSVLLIAIALYSVSRQKNFMENYSQELNGTLNEAMNVRIELESIMENAVQISQSIVDKYAEQIGHPSEIPTELEVITHFITEDSTQEEISMTNMISAPPEVEHEILAKSKAIRIYELARDLQMPSKELIRIIKDLGINVKSHMNVLDDMQLALIKQAIDSDLRSEQDRKICGSIPINGHDLNQSVSKDSGLDLIIGNEDLNYENYADFSLNKVEYGKLEEQSLQVMEFSIDELKKAHPYIAINTMYDNGYPIREIAKLLGRGQGEVSLILNLSKKRAAGI